MSFAGAISLPRRTPAAPVVTASSAQAHADTGAGLVVVRAAEAFDQAAFALAAFLVFPAVFFPYWGELLGTLYGVALFALAFAMRPAGRLAGQMLRGRYPAPRVVAGAAVLLAGFTAVVGMLPAYAAAGSLAILLLTACRTAQGLAWGACGPLPQAQGSAAVSGALVGVAAACGLMAFIASQMVHADFVAWGWRYPFCAALAVHVVALFARLRLACGTGRAD